METRKKYLKLFGIAAQKFAGVFGAFVLLNQILGTFSEQTFGIGYVLGAGMAIIYIVTTLRKKH